MQRNIPIDKYLKLPEPVKASIWFAVSNVIHKGISLLSTPIFTRLLTTEEYGVYSIYQSWDSIILIFATLNLYAGVYNNGITKWPDDRERYTSSLQGLSTAITISLFVIYLLFIDRWNRLLNLSTVFVLAIFAEALFVPAFNFWSAGKRFDYKYRKLVAVSLCMGLMSPVIGVVSVLASAHKAEARVLSFSLVQVCVGLIFYIYNFHKGKKIYIRKYWAFALKFNLPLIPHYLAQVVLNQADRIMIADMVGNSEAAIYSVAYTVSMMFTIVTDAINNSFIPYTYKSLRDKRYDNLKGNSSFLVLLISAACMIAMAFGPEIIKIFAAPEYYEARWVVPPVACALLFKFIFPLFCNIEFYFERTGFIMIASSLAAVVNIVLNYFAIHWFGYIAAAYTTLLCYIFLAAAHYAAYKRICKHEGINVNVYNISAILLISLGALLAMILMTLLYDSIILRYSVILVLMTILLSRYKYIIAKINEIRGNHFMR